MRIRQVKNSREKSKEIACLPKARKEAQVKVYRPKKSGSSGFLAAIRQNPNFGFQLVVIIMTFISDDGKMERSIDGMTHTAEKIKNVADLLNSTMNSVRVAAETPRKIRKMLE